MLVECYTTRGFAIYASVLVRFTIIARIAARLNCARIAQCDSHEAGAKLAPSELQVSSKLAHPSPPIIMFNNVILERKTVRRRPPHATRVRRGACNAAQSDG